MTFEEHEEHYADIKEMLLELKPAPLWKKALTVTGVMVVLFVSFFGFMSITEDGGTITIANSPETE